MIDPAYTTAAVNIFVNIERNVIDRLSRERDSAGERRNKYEYRKERARLS
jgi:hypothetical protein